MYNSVVFSIFTKEKYVGITSISYKPTPEALKNITDDTLGAKKGKFSIDGRSIIANNVAKKVAVSLHF